MTASRYRLDELRRFASALLAATGLPPARASALATHLLWHDAAGLDAFGFATLPDWLERIEGRVVDRAAEGKVTREMTGTAVFDGQNGIGPLLLARAGELAVEKARDAGVGLVRVLNVGPAGPAAAIAAELAIGPFVGAVLGRDSSWALALPTREGLPAVFDSALETTRSADPRDLEKPPLLDHLFPWAAVLAPEGGWLVSAIAVGALEPLGTFHERVADALKGLAEKGSPLLPEAWDARRREAREHGVVIAPATWQALRPWAERLAVLAPEPALPPGSSCVPAPPEGEARENGPLRLAAIAHSKGRGPWSCR